MTMSLKQEDMRRTFADVLTPTAMTPRPLWTYFTGATMSSLALVGTFSCTRTTTSVPSHPVTIEADWRLLHTSTISLAQGDSLVLPSSLLVMDSMLVLADGRGGRVRLLHRRTGALVREVTDTQRFSFPHDLALLPGRQFAVLDFRSLKLFDAWGRRLGAVPLPGTFSAMNSLPGKAVLLGGYHKDGEAFRWVADSTVEVTHEMTAQGVIQNSSRRLSIANSPPLGGFLRNFALASSTDWTASAVYASDSVHLRHRATGREIVVATAFPGYRTPDFASAHAIERLSGSTRAEQTQVWLRRQITLIRLLPLAGDRWLSEFQLFDSTDQRLLVYVMFDVNGRKLGSFAPSTAIALRSVGDTILMVRRQSTGRWQIEERLVSP